MNYWREHGTKIIGGVALSIGTVAAVPGVIPPHWMPYCTAAIGVLTIWRGITNTITAQSSSEPPVK